MKVVIVLLSLAAFAAADLLKYNTAYGYLKRFGIPMAEKIRAQEEEYLRNPISRIFNGSPAAHGQFGYQAGLISEIVGTSGRGVCGGVLISETRVLTAAHCWFDGLNQAWRVEVILGSVTLFTGGTRILSTDVVMHPEWFPLLIRNDIAVIHLPAVQLSDNIRVIALPTGSLAEETFEGEIATTSGFGMIGNTVPIASNQSLSYGKAPIISNSQCQLAFPWFVTSSNICIGTEGASSPCRGDSGGPLVVERDDIPVLLGIVSFGPHPDIGGCEAERPAVFARVTSFLRFIEENM